MRDHAARSLEAQGPDPFRGILFKLGSVVLFVLMQTCIKAVGPRIPAGEITFFRCAFAIAPILLYFGLVGELRRALETASVARHLVRGVIGILGMGFGFYGLTKLPMPDAVAIGYSAPLIAVVFAALFLGERVGAYRWTAVAIGMVGVLIVSWPKLTMIDDGGLRAEQAFGAAAVIVGAVMGGLAMLQTRQLLRTDRSATIVLYMSLFGSSMSLLTAPFGWAAPGWTEGALLASAGIAGGLGQILVIEAYRHAEASTVAPFDYTSILLAVAIAYLLFGDVPTLPMIVGTGFTALAGLCIVHREHRLGVERRAARPAPPPNL